MESESTDPVWKLLEQSPSKRASGAFSQNVMREIRQLEAQESEECCGGIWAWFTNRSMLAAAAVAVVALVLTFTLFHSTEDAGVTGGTIAESTAVEDPAVYITAEEEALYGEVLTEELEVMAFVDELLTVSDPSQLDDAALAELLF